MTEHIFSFIDLSTTSKCQNQCYLGSAISGVTPQNPYNCATDPLGLRCSPTLLRMRPKISVPNLSQKYFVIQPVPLSGYIKKMNFKY